METGAGGCGIEHRIFLMSGVKQRTSNHPTVFPPSPMLITYSQNKIKCCNTIGSVGRRMTKHSHTEQSTAVICYLQSKPGDFNVKLHFLEDRFQNIEKILSTERIVFRKKIL